MVLALGLPLDAQTPLINESTRANVGPTLLAPAPKGTAIINKDVASHVRYAGGAPSGNFTAMGWFKLSENPNAPRDLIAIGGSVSAPLYRNLHLLGTDWDGATLHVTSLTPGTPVCQGGTLAVGQWHHAAIVGNTGTGQSFKIFFDGAMVATGTASEQVGPYIPDMVEIGGLVGHDTDHLTGSFCDLKIWNTKLTHTEIQLEMGCYRALRRESLWMEVPLRTPDDVADLSGNGRDLVATGPAFGTDFNGPAIPFDHLHNCSELNEQCRIGVFNVWTDACEAQAVANGEPCDDDVRCTVEDTCAAGVCSGHARDCSAFTNQCNTGTCDEATGECGARPVTEGTSCKDEFFCTDQDVCVGGVCQGSPRNCSEAGDQCNDGVCNEHAARCEGQPVARGSPCNDGIFCTVDDECVEGSCRGFPRDCSGVDDQCNRGICNEELGSCVKQPIDDGTSCDDGLFCTVEDICLNGACVGGPRSCERFADSCNIAVCVEALGSCETSSVADGSPCDDDVFCTVEDVCDDGACRGIPRECSDFGDQCNAAVCNEDTHECEPAPFEDARACDDEDSCTIEDVCEAGVCRGSREFALSEWRRLGDCLLGPDAGVEDGCECFDVNHDGRIDLLDVVAFQGLFVAE